MGENEPREAARAEQHVPLWEWIVACLGLALVLGTIGFLLYEGVAGSTSPPDVVVVAGDVLPVRQGYLVQFRAVNRGGSTAADVAISGELRRGSAVVERSQTIVDYVPSRSERRGGLFFANDPRGLVLELRATSYVEP